MQVVRRTQEAWVQTTTLEGGHDWTPAPLRATETTAKSFLNGAAIAVAQFGYIKP